MSEALFTFDTTHMALWAEEVAREAAIPAEVVPAPPYAKALCDLALAVQPKRVGDAEAAFRSAGVIFRPPIS